MNTPKVTISLRVIGNTLSCNEVTSLLGCLPTATLEKGDPVNAAKTVKSPAGNWLLKSDFAEAGIDQMVSGLLAKLTTDLSVWNKLRSTSRIDLFCGIFLQSPNQGFSLRPETLMELANRGITLSLDLYSFECRIAP